MACFATFISAQNRPGGQQTGSEKETEKESEKKTPQSEPGTPNQPSENPQKLSDGTKKATIVKNEPKKEKVNN